MRILFQILLIFLAVVTLCICVIKPDMHKSLIVYNSDYELVPEEVKTTEQKNITIVKLPIKPQQVTTKIETNVQKITVNTQKSERKKKEVQNPIKISENTTENNKLIKTASTGDSQTVKSKQNHIKTEVQLPQKVLTVQEEEIAWNIWRSNLQNKIMQEVKLPVMPNGIIFKFSFNVDKYGKVSNVQSWSTTSAYTPYAIQYISPVIRSYQGKDILNFPQGSTRTVTEVKGGWKLSSVEKYSTPQDYNDIEKVIK